MHIDFCFAQLHWTFFHKDYNVMVPHHHDCTKWGWLEEKASELSPPNPEFIFKAKPDNQVTSFPSLAVTNPKARELAPPQSPPPAASG